MFEELERRDADVGIGPAIWALTYMALKDYETALRYFNSAIDERVYGDLALYVIRRNYFRDPILDSDPLWVEARNRIARTD